MLIFMEFKGEVHNENVKVSIKVFVTNYREVHLWLGK
jgi:hypothetical protein